MTVPIYCEGRGAGVRSISLLNMIQVVRLMIYIYFLYLSLINSDLH